MLNNKDGTDFLNLLIKRGRLDVLNEIIRNDCLLLSFGELLFATYGEKHYHHITQRLRELARLIKEFQIKRPNIKMIDLLSPQNFDAIVDQMKMMIYSSERQDNPKTFGIRVGHSLKKCGIIARSKAIKIKDSDLRAQMDDFLQVYEAEWSKRISSICLRNLYDADLSKEQTIPLTTDLVKLSNFLNERIKLIVNAENENITENDWIFLAKLTMSKLINFNKRRSGEVGKMKLINYTDRPKWNIHKEDEIYSSLTTFEKKLAQGLDLIKIKGKHGRHVPLIITEDVSKALSILSKNRSHIKEENPYFFANRGDFYLRPCEVLKEMCIKAGVQNVNSMNSTSMRKYIATTSQILNLNSEELDILAKRLGHDINIHRKFYRLGSSTLELAKVSKLLMAVDSGEAHNYAGKSLNDLEPDRSRSPLIPLQLNINDSSNTQNEIYNTDEEKDSDSSESRSPLRPIHTNKIKGNNKQKPWDKKIKAEALKYLNIEMKLKKAPGKTKCETFIQKKNLVDRKWTDIKNLIKNSYYKR